VLFCIFKVVLYDLVPVSTEYMFVNRQTVFLSLTVVKLQLALISSAFAILKYDPIQFELKSVILAFIFL